MASESEISERDMAPYREYHAERARLKLEQREVHRHLCLEAARCAVRRLAPEFESIRAVYLFGSLLQPGRFTRRSDVDVAIQSDDITVEGHFRRSLEKELRRDVDLRPLEGRIAWAVEHYGECVYEREVPDSGA